MNMDKASASPLLEAARGFAAETMAAKAAEWERAGAAPREAFVAAAEAGLRGVLVPRDQGGCGLSFVEAAELLEVLSGANAAFAFALWVHNNVTNGIARSGTAAHKQEHLGDMLAGKRLGAFCLTEPGVGSDATAITTHAESRGDGWVLTGTKAWITNGVRADVFVVYAQTEPGAGAGGIAAFVVPAERAGVHRGEPYGLPGATAYGLSDVAFEGCELTDADLLLPPGQGFKEAMGAINQARTFVGAACCGMLAVSLEIALKYAAERRAFGQPVLSFQGLQWPLADVATDLEAARALTRRAAEALDRGEKAIVEAAHAKKFASRAAFDGVSKCMQAMGAAGLRDDYPLARHLTAAKMTHFVDGTTEMQNMVIARALLRQHGLSLE